MSRTCVLVRCVDCGGTGIGKEPYTDCEYCLGGGKMNVDRAPDGGVPDQQVEWVDHDIGPTPINPLTLRTDARKA